MNLNLVKHITTVFLFLVFFQKVTFCQNTLTQSAFSSTFNDENIGLDNFTYRLNFLLSNTTNSSNNKIFPGILQTENIVEMALFIPNGFSPTTIVRLKSWSAPDTISEAEADPPFTSTTIGVFVSVFSFSGL